MVSGILSVFGKSSLISDFLRLYDVLRILNKFCKYIGESPLIALNINIAFNFFRLVDRLSQWSLFRRKLVLVS